MLEKNKITIFLTLFFMLGIFVFFKELEILGSLVVLFLTALLFLKEKISLKTAISMVLVFIIGVFYTDYKMIDDDLLYSIAPTEGTLTGKVVSIPTTTFEDRTKFFFNVTQVNTEFESYKTNSKTFVTISDTKENYKRIKIGDNIKLKAKLRIPQESANPSQFSYKNYLKNFNTFTTAYTEPNEWSIISPPSEAKWKFLQNLNILRHKILNNHNKTVKSPNLEILGGIVFGDDAISPPEDIKDYFIQSGLMHILAASGLNVALIFSIWFFIFSKLRIPYRFGITSGIFLILFYTLMTGLGPPVLRAALMLTFALLGKLIDRDADNIALLLFVASIILIYNPAYLFDVSFQLSFVVTLGLLVFCPILAEKTKQVPQVIAGAIYVPLIAQIVVAPIQMFYFNTFALYSLIANIISLPFVSAISFLGFISSILAILPKFPSVIISGFDYIINPFISVLISISKTVSNLPNSLLITTQCNVTQIVFYYILLVFVYLILKNGFEKKLTIGALLIVAFLALSTIKINNNNLEAIFFSVGNADSILVKTPDNKYCIVDTAHAPFRGTFTQAKAIIYEYLKDNGIKEIEYLIITHYDADHAGGATALIDLIKINNIVLNENINKDRIATEIIDSAKRKGINIIYPKSGSKIAYQGGEIKFFRSDKNYITKNDHDNENSIVTLFTKRGKNLLLSGDANVTVLKEFNLPNTIDVFKVGHHGAKDTTDLQFITDKSIKTAVLSTGPNQYYHPSYETLYNLQKANVQILRTDTQNAIKISISEKDIKYFHYDNKKSNWVKLK